jgi:hypothetical protein
VDRRGMAVRAEFAYSDLTPRNKKGTRRACPEIFM